MDIYEQFDPTKFSIIFALNMSLVIEHSIINRMVKNNVANLHGVYNNRQERSYQIERKLVNWQILKGWLHYSKQDTILYIDNGLVYVGTEDYDYKIDAMTKPIGRLIKVDKVDAGMDYTYCPVTKSYYVIQEEGQ